MTTFVLVFCAVAMLATQLNHLVNDDKLEKFAVIRVENSMCNFVRPDKRIFIILDLTIISPGSEVGHEIGNPKMMDMPNPNQSAASVSVPAHNPVMATAVPTSVVASVPKPKSNIPYAYAQDNTAVNLNIRPIDSLTPYQNKWTIRARVTNKSSIRTWSNSRGEGKLFSMDLLDESGEIRATCFKEECDKFYEMIELNKTYYISRAAIKPANKQYTTLTHMYEMTFNRDTTVEPCTDGTGDDLPCVQFNFVAIADIAKRENNSLVDVIGVVKRANDVQTIMSRTANRELRKRDLWIVDSSNVEVSLTLWGEQADNFNGENSILAIKGARVSEFGGRSLSLIGSSTMLVDPDIDEVKRLRTWFTDSGSATTAESLTKSSNISNMNTAWKMMGNIKTDNLGMNDRPDYYAVTAFVTLCRKENCLYKACATEGCNKKVIDQNNGMYRCEKCNKEFDNFTWRLILQVNLADCSGDQWVTCFQESAEFILETTASQLAELKESDEDAFHALMDAVLFKRFTFKLRSKMESFNDENRLKTTVVSVSKMNHLEHIKRIIGEIKTMSQK